MGKLKTNKAMRKRFKVTKKGKVLASSSLRRHLLADRTSKKKRQTRGWKVLDAMDAKRVLRGLHYA